MMKKDKDWDFSCVGQSGYRFISVHPQGYWVRINAVRDGKGRHTKFFGISSMRTDKQALKEAVSWRNQKIAEIGLVPKTRAKRIRACHQDLITGLHQTKSSKMLQGGKKYYDVIVVSHPFFPNKKRSFRFEENPRYWQRTRSEAIALAEMQRIAWEIECNMQPQEPKYAALKPKRGRRKNAQ
ncbi:hypothetical protein [Pseudobowmanella zhangzhouensis]